MNPIMIIIAVCYLLFFPLLGAWIGGMRNRGFEGVLLGLVLGPFGVLLAALLPRGEAGQKNETLQQLAGTIGGGLAMALPVLFGIAVAFWVFVKWV
jgi:hypothetical protein